MNVSADHLREHDYKKSVGSNLSEIVVDPARRHYQTLDGLRGVAALCVFLVHCFSRNIATNGFLGVDFFFMLSGFVVASAYSRKLQNGSLRLREFALRRSERLWPMLVMGTALGLAAAFVHNLTAQTGAYPVPGLIALTLLSLIVTPQIRLIGIDDTAFPLNTVVWSLFFEVLANLFYAVMARWIGLRLAVTLAALGLAAMLVFGTEGGGTIPDLYLGVPRVMFGFFSGIALWEAHCAGLLRKVPGLGLLTLSVPLLAITFIPFELHGLAFLPAAAVFLGLIASGAQDQPAGRGLAVCVWLGALSYPLYLVHRPLLYIVPGLMKKVVPMVGVGYYMAVAVTLAVSVLLSFALERFYEVPVRRWIRSKVLSRA